VLVFHFLAVVAQYSHPVGEVVIVRQHRPSVAISSQVFTGVKAENRLRRQKYGFFLPLVSRTVRLGAVFHHEQVVFPRYIHDRPMSAGWPYRCTGITARVRGVIAASSFSGSGCRYAGRRPPAAPAPRCVKIASQVQCSIRAGNDFHCQAPTPRPRSAKGCSASVPELTPGRTFTSYIFRRRPARKPSSPRPS